ncbi:ABC transporter permease [Planctomycetota bacterium]
MFTQLLWKEWRENLWKLSFCLTVSLAFTMLLFRVRLFTDMANCLILSMVLTFAVPVIYALDLFAGEMSNRTIHLLFKIPVPRWQIFFSKMVVTFIGFGLTFVITGLIMEIMAHGRETTVGMLMGVHLWFALCATLLFVWFAVFGCQNRSEATSLVTLAGVLIGWGIVFFWSTICEVGWATHCVPYAFAYAGQIAVTRVEFAWLNVPLLLLVQSLSLAIALALACYRYGKIRRYL